MSSISTGVGLISGINSASLIESLIQLESRGKFTLQTRLANIQAQKTALLDVNARLLNLKSASRAFRIDKIFDAVTASSSNEETLTATASTSAQPGTYKFIVKQLVQTSQHVSRGFATRDAPRSVLTRSPLSSAKGAWHATSRWRTSMAAPASTAEASSSRIAAAPAQPST